MAPATVSLKRLPDGLPVVVFAVRDSIDVTRTYSWRLQQNFGAHNDYAADILALPSSAMVLVGTKDSVLIPEAILQALSGRPDSALQGRCGSA